MREACPAALLSRSRGACASFWIQIAKVFYYHWVDPFDSFFFLLVIVQNFFIITAVELYCAFRRRERSREVKCKCATFYVIKSISSRKTTRCPSGKWKLFSKMSNYSGSCRMQLLCNSASFVSLTKPLGARHVKSNLKPKQSRLKPRNCSFVPT